MRLSTDRLLLRDFKAGDFEAVHAYSADPRSWTHVHWDANTPEMTRAYLRTCLAEARARPRTVYTLAVVLDGNRLVGSVSLHLHDRYQAELGYVIHPEYWGRRLATEAVIAILNFAWDSLGLHRVQATCRPENLASVRVLRNVGMMLEERLRNHVMIDGKWRDSLLYAAIRPGKPTDGGTVRGG